MQTASLTNNRKANSATELKSSLKRTVVRAIPAADLERTTVRFTSAVLRKAHALFDGRFRKRLTGLAKVHIRTVDNWKSANRTIDADQIFHLLEGDYGVAFFEAFWECIPEKTRDRWIEQEILRRRLVARQAARAAADEEIEQLQMTLQSR